MSSGFVSNFFIVYCLIVDSDCDLVRVLWCEIEIIWCVVDWICVELGFGLIVLWSLLVIRVIVCVGW